jgi:hypothetical protein
MVGTRAMLLRRTVTVKSERAFFPGHERITNDSFPYVALDIFVVVIVAVADFYRKYNSITVRRTTRRPMCIIF